MRFVKLLVATGLAWLGLAGLVDAWLEWQQWFEQGVMQHWRSVKVWIVAVLLDWVPFNIPLWIIDYSVVGMIVVRCAPYRALSRPPWPLKETLASFVRVGPVVFLLWPVALYFILIRGLESLDDPRMRDSLQLLGASFVGFIPFLFLVSTTLYRFG